MNTLVIHPLDKSTEMLELVYKDKNYTVIRDYNISKEELINKIKTHDRIIFLGHGTPEGLINPKFLSTFKKEDMYLIDDSFASLLKDKETVSMWCYSDIFFKRNNIKGFHTGMIISEVREAYYVLNYCPLDKEELYNNMVLLSKVFNECIDKSALEMKEHILSKYVGNDDITKFNRSNIKVL
jgi:hypothetical protein